MVEYFFSGELLSLVAVVFPDEHNEGTPESISV